MSADCVCGHELDEHDEKSACAVDDCPCIYFEADDDEAGGC